MAGQKLGVNQAHFVVQTQQRLTGDLILTLKGLGMHAPFDYYQQFMPEVDHVPSGMPDLHEGTVCVVKDFYQLAIMSQRSGIPVPLLQTDHLLVFDPKAYKSWLRDHEGEANPGPRDMLKKAADVEDLNKKIADHLRVFHPLTEMILQGLAD